jgi:putative aldouronate transport system permease protein
MKKIKHANASDMIFDIINYSLLAIIFIITLYPFYYVLILSFNNGLDAMRGGIYLWPREFTLDNYKMFLNDQTWSTALIVTVMRTVIGTILSLFFTCLVAYGLSFEKLLFRRFYMLLVIICMYFSGGLIPYYMTLKYIGLLNNFMVYIIPTLINFFFVLVAISFFQDIPKEMRESAMLDGASEITILTRIILPVSTPLLATIALFIGVGHWNSWFDSAFFVNDENLRTLGYLMMEIINKSQISASTGGTAALAAASNQSTTSTSVQMTAVIIAIAPIICVYPFLQKYFVKGIMIGSVKG